MRSNVTSHYASVTHMIDLANQKHSGESHLQTQQYMQRCDVTLVINFFMLIFFFLLSFFYG